MLGPEQINVAQRPTPIFLEGTAPVRITEEVALQLGLKDSQTVRAVIENRGDLLRLIMNQRDMNWTSASRFKPGDKINLRVSFSSGGVTLTPVSGEGAQSVSAKGVKHLLPTGLLSATHRPSQASVLSSVLKPGGLDQISTHMGAREWVLRLDQLKNSMSRLTPSTVKESFSLSGLFGEASLLSSKKNMKPDLKQVLRGLLRAIPNGSQISKNIEQAVLEIEGRQVESLSNQNSREVSFQFSLPFSDADPVQVGLYREQDVEDSTNYRWIINLHTKSDVLGEIWLKTSLLSQSNVEMIMWAPQAEVAEGARLVTSELEYELKNFGLILDKFTVLNAARPVSENAPGGAGNVVDVST